MELDKNKDSFHQFDSYKLNDLDHGDSLLIPIKINHQSPLITGLNNRMTFSSVSVIIL